MEAHGYVLQPNELITTMTHDSSRRWLITTMTTRRSRRRKRRKEGEESSKHSFAFHGGVVVIVHIVGIGMVTSWLLPKYRTTRDVSDASSASSCYPLFCIIIVIIVTMICLLEPWASVCIKIPHPKDPLGQTSWGAACTASIRTKYLDVSGFDTGRFWIVMGGIPRSKGSFPQI